MILLKLHKKMAIDTKTVHKTHRMELYQEQQPVK